MHSFYLRFLILSKIIFIILCFYFSLAPWNFVCADESNIKPYLKIYPEFKVESLGKPSQPGDVVGNLGTHRNDTVVLTNSIARRTGSVGWVWSNSYVGMLVEHPLGGHRVGVDLQYEVDFQGEASPFENLRGNLQTRDAYLFYDNERWGRLQLGKFDSIYKDWGDRYPMLGLTSGNFIANSRLLSQAGWRGGGSTSFNNRRGHSLLYVTPSMGSIKIGAMHSYDAGTNDPGGPGTKLGALGLRWDGEKIYMALLVEKHMDWLPMSAGSSPAPSSVRNSAAMTTSRDIGYRLALGWNPNNFKVSLDLARLGYRERGLVSEVGRFKKYQNETFQVTVQYLGIENIRLALNAAFANAGRCELTGGVSCSTQGLGGSQVSAGLIYSYSPQLSVFSLMTKVNNKPGSRYGGGPQGAEALIYAAGIKIEHR